MNYSRTLKPVCSLLATALLALAQTPAPVPAPQPVPMPMPAPAAPLPPLLPMDIDLGDLDVQIPMVKEMTLSPELQDQMEAVKEQIGLMKLDMKERAKEMAKTAQLAPFAFAPQAVPPRPPTPPMPPKEIMFRGRGRGTSSQRYSAGQGALDSHEWGPAVDCFNEIGRAHV